MLTCISEEQILLTFQPLSRRPLLLVRPDAPVGGGGRAYGRAHHKHDHDDDVGHRLLVVLGDSQQNGA